MAELKLPYSFVPCSDMLYIPEWAHEVSHDIPFKDSFSGSIDITLTNMGYLCVGAQSQQSDDKQYSAVGWATDDDDRLVIPGSSIKGMLRNDLSIISFGKFQQFNRRHHSFRDISSTKTDYAVKYSALVPKAGWLKRDSNDSYSIRFCKCAKAFNKDISREIGAKICNSYPDGGKNLSRTKEGCKKNPTAVDKYKIAADSPGKITLNKSVSATLLPLERKTNNSGIYEQTYFSCSPKYDSNNCKEGYLVFTNYRLENEKTGNCIYVDYSYYFYDVEAEKKKIDSQIVKNFKDAQSCVDVRDLIDYLFENQNNDLGIPVWVFSDKKGKVMQLGICRMPRLMYMKSISDCVPQNHYNELDCIFDLPELMFGTIRNGKGSNFSLKSRIGISDFVSQQKSSNLKFQNKKIVLQSPKTSYTDGYLVNAKNNDSTTYEKQESVISGWKRYKVQDHFAEVVNSTVTDANMSTVNFLTQSDTSFKGTILFHNLKKEELGALLYTIEFWNKENCYHMLGHGKPYGAGAVTMNVDGLNFPSYCNDECKISANDAIEAFKNEMNRHFGKLKNAGDWENSIQIRNLKQISSVHSDYTSINDTVYNDLKEFVKLHQDKKFLRYEVKLGDNDKHDHKFEFYDPDYFNQYGKLLKNSAEDRMSEESLKLEKRIIEAIEAENSRKQKEKTLAAFNEHELVLYKFIEEFNNKNLNKDICTAEREKFFNLIRCCKDNLGNINSEISSSFIELLNKPVGEAKIRAIITTLSQKNKKDETKKKQYSEIKQYIVDIENSLK